eukprot:6414270-Pyramimonas_sp.AAC.1
MFEGRTMRASRVLGPSPPCASIPSLWHPSSTDRALRSAPASPVRSTIATPAPTITTRAATPAAKSPPPPSSGGRWPLTSALTSAAWSRFVSAA